MVENSARWEQRRLPPSTPPVPSDAVQERLAQLLINAALPQYRDWVLDVGCGTGYVLQVVAARVGSAGRVVGIDQSEAALAPVRRWRDAAWLRRVELYVMDAGRLEFPNATFTLVTCGMALHRLPDPTDALREVFRVLRPGGWVALTVPHPESGESLRTALAQRLRETPALPAAGPPAPLWDERHIAGLLALVGFATVHIQVIRQQARYADAGAWWQTGGPALPESELPPQDARVTQALQTLQQANGTPTFDVPLITTIAMARKGSGTG